jgi:hypothetical protein
MILKELLVERSDRGSSKVPYQRLRGGSEVNLKVLNHDNQSPGRDSNNNSNYELKIEN